VYINRGSDAGISNGDLFTALRRTRSVRSTRDRVGDLGVHYLELGQMQVVMTQAGFSMARIVQACDAIEVGDTIVAFETIDFPELPENRPINAMLPSSGKITGAIAITRDTLSNVGSAIYNNGITETGVSGGRLGGVSLGVAAEGQIVYIDLGNRDGVQTGDLFLVYRPLGNDTPLFQLSDEARELLEGQREVIGELVVLKVEERAATALITFSSGGLSPGDPIELR
jgi:hypothetical protein